MEITVPYERLGCIVCPGVEIEIVKVRIPGFAKIRGDAISISFVGAVQQDVPVEFDALCPKRCRQDLIPVFMIAIKPTGRKVNRARKVSTAPNFFEFPAVVCIRRARIDKNPVLIVDDSQYIADGQSGRSCRIRL